MQMKMNRKEKKTLKECVESELPKINNRKQFFEPHLISDIDFKLSNFDEFYQTRKVMLSKKLREIL